MPPRFLFHFLIWGISFGLPATAWNNPKSLLLKQQILNNRQQQGLLTEHYQYQRRLRQLTPTENLRLQQRLQQQRLHQKQLQRQQIQKNQWLRKQQTRPEITGTNPNTIKLLRSRRAQEQQRLRFHLERQTWPYR